MFKYLLNLKNIFKEPVNQKRAEKTSTKLITFLGQASIPSKHTILFQIPYCLQCIQDATDQSNVEDRHMIKNESACLSIKFKNSATTSFN